MVHFGGYSIVGTRRPVTNCNPLAHLTHLLGCLDGEPIAHLPHVPHLPWCPTYAPDPIAPPDPLASLDPSPPWGQGARAASRARRTSGSSLLQGRQVGQVFCNRAKWVKVCCRWGKCAASAPKGARVLQVGQVGQAEREGRQASTRLCKASPTCSKSPSRTIHFEGDFATKFERDLA